MGWWETIQEWFGAFIDFLLTMLDSWPMIVASAGVIVAFVCALCQNWYGAVIAMLVTLAWVLGMGITLSDLLTWWIWW